MFIWFPDFHTLEFAALAVCSPPNQEEHLISLPVLSPPVNLCGHGRCFANEYGILFGPCASTIVFCILAHPTLCGDQRGRGAKTHGFLRCLTCSRDPLRGTAWSRCKNPWFFCDFCGARATLCGDRRGRGAKTRGFLRFLKFPRDPLRESAWSRCKTHGFLRCLTCSRDPLRESAWSRCKNPWFFAMFNLLARPSAGDRRGRGAKTQGFFAISAVLAQPFAVLLSGQPWSSPFSQFFLNGIMRRCNSG